MEGRIKKICVDGKEILVSDLGHIYNLKGKEYANDENSKGYSRVSLSTTINGVKHRGRYSVHRLVATAFLPNPNNLQQINHKDLCRTNNKVENLEWCDQSYNMRHSISMRNSLFVKRIGEVPVIPKTSADHLIEGRWAKFLKSLPDGCTSWTIPDNNNVLLIRSTARYITRVGGRYSFSIHKVRNGGDFVEIRKTRIDGNA